MEVESRSVLSEGLAQATLTVAKTSRLKRIVFFTAMYVTRFY